MGTAGQLPDARNLIWCFGQRSFDLSDRPIVMGIVNVTPDSFSDGGQFHTIDAAVAHARQLLAEGADLLDIGGESTRPGATPVSEAEELDRVVPVIERIRREMPGLVSIDTMKPTVAAAALAAGAEIINDVSGFRDPAMIDIARKLQAGVIVMHMQGTPATMQREPTYGNVVTEVADYLAGQTQTLITAGIPREAIVLDPGIGFGKTHAQTLAQLAAIEPWQKLGRPICLGVSRKGFLGIITGKPRSERVSASVAVVLLAASWGTAHVLRVHDVAATVDAVKVLRAIQGVTI